MPYIGKKPADIIATVIDTTTGTFSGEVDAGSLDVSGNADIDGITNLDNTDIDGTLDVSGNLTVDTNTLYVDSANNRVGVGTVSPSSPLHISLPSSGTDVEGWRVSSGGGGILYVRVDNAASANPTWEMNVAASEQLAFGIGASEAMRIDSSRNLLVGGTSAAEAGSLTVYPTGIVQARVIGNNAIIADRTSTDGEIIDFRKDGSTVGSIGTQNGSDFYITGTASDDTGLRFQTNEIVPVNDAGGNRDNAIDLGKSNIRFKDLYLSTTAYATTLAGVSDTNTFIRFEGSDVMTFRTGNAERIRITSGGNVAVGGTNSTARFNAIAANWPENAIGVYSANIAGQNNFAGIGFFNQDTDSTTGNVADIYTNPTGTLSLTSAANPAIQLKYGSPGISGGTAALTVDSSGNVGIGTISPSQKLHVSGSVLANNYLLSPSAATIGTVSDTSIEMRTSADSLPSMIFRANGVSERMRIDSSGNLLVGTTDASVFNNVSSGTGINLQNFGNIAVARDGNDCMALNRLNSYGEIVKFLTDGSSVGSIGTAGGTPYFSNTNNSKGIRIYSNGFAACDGSGNFADNAQDIGASSVRWRNLYLSSGVYLGGTGSANKLDDAETGTWTPAVYNGAVTLGTIYRAAYVKVGKLVFVQLYAAISASGNASAFQLEGLPFSTPATGYATGSVDFGRGGVKGQLVRKGSNNDRVEFLYPSESLSTDRVAIVGNQVDVYVIFSITYETTA